MTTILRAVGDHLFAASVFVSSLVFLAGSLL